MSDSSPTDYRVELAGGVIEVASQFINQKIVETIWKNFSGDGKTQRSDFYMGQSHELLQTYFQEIDHKDKQNILHMLTRLDQIAWAWQLACTEAWCNRVRDIQLKMDNANIPGVQRFFKTMHYKHLSKLTYKMIVVGHN